ncbi:MAG: bifunctional precorrin-2 dehydrogenase/sirohydrochlorin ferrochelatase, partial [Actinomycetota bacterium]
GFVWGPDGEEEHEVGHQFPVNLNLEGRSVLVVGGGRIAFRKTEQILPTGAQITVVAPEIRPEFEALDVVRVRRGFRDADLDGVRLVITATGVREVDQAVFDGAEWRGVWVNSADDPDRCTFTLPAVVRRGALMVTTSTAGASPALSSFLRARVAEMLGDEWAHVVEDLSERRRDFHARGISTETIDWRPIIDEVLADRGLTLPGAVAPAGAAVSAGDTVPAEDTVEVPA